MPKKKVIKETEIIPKEGNEVKSIKKNKIKNNEVAPKSLDPSVYEYRYFTNTNKGGTIFLKDLKKPKMIEFDSTNGKTIYKISVEECNQSSDLSHHLKLGNLNEITSSYISYLESDSQDSFHYSSSSTPENKQPYVHVPGAKKNIKLSTDYDQINKQSRGVTEPLENNSEMLPTPEELSKIEGSSDQQAHMANVNKTSNVKQQNNIMELNVGDSNDTSLVNPINYADRSSHHQVDSRMYSQLEIKRPESAKMIQMRDINDPFFLSNDDFESAQNQSNPPVQHVVNNDESNNPQLSKFIEGIINL